MTHEERLRQENTDLLLKLAYAVHFLAERDMLEEGLMVFPDGDSMSIREARLTVARLIAVGAVAKKASKPRKPPFKLRKPYKKRRKEKTVPA